MTDIAIRVENLGKRYQIGASKSGSFRESLSHLFRRDTGKRKTENGKGKREIGKNAPVSGLRSPSSVSDFWALQDINFEIKRGEAVGIIGRNGAGKSTLLKILSRITEPTRGRFEIFGRVSSLLEVGTGFHPELTGRENVYLNGTILGMKRREVKAKFDEIVAFSGVEKFIDTPVKHYSSGMQVRLAFAVAAHLEPEILIIDEVLAVGDAEFQKKCLGKMEDVTGEGRTVLFVSHNMGAVRDLCNQAILISKGTIAEVGKCNKVIETYLSGMINKSSGKIPFNPNSRCYIERATLTDIDDKPVSELFVGQSYKIKLNLIVKENIRELIIGLGVATGEDSPVRTTWAEARDFGQGKYEISFAETTVFFCSGKYKVAVGLSRKGDTLQYVDDALIIDVENYVAGDVALRSDLGVVINQMKVSVSKIDEQVKEYFGFIP